ncbi:MAG: polymer-forming cytoskeletal protein [Lachnospiraceae bacterium]|nr:polymer-forming cytoskeletal protein [Lachnospiraceae bacterium]
MGFFSDLKEDLSSAVNELVPDENLDTLQEENTETATVAEADEMTLDQTAQEDAETKAEETGNTSEMADLDALLSKVDSIEVPDDMLEENPVEETATEAASVTPPVQNTQEKNQFFMGANKRMDAKMVSDETSVITGGMKIIGDIESEGSVEFLGTITGNISIQGKLNATGTINGNSRASEIFADNAKITGDVTSEGSIKLGQGTVIIGNVNAQSAVIAGAIKGDIDVHGPVILDTSAIVMGNIKSKSVQINNGAVIEGLCSQCYADVNPTSFFDELKKGPKK